MAKGYSYVSTFEGGGYLSADMTIQFQNSQTIVKILWTVFIIELFIGNLILYDNIRYRQKILNPFWTDENIKIISNIDVPEFRFLRQEAQIRALKCIPKEQIFKIDDLIREKGDSDGLLDLIIPNQKVVLPRCLPDYSHCERLGTKCLPTQLRSKMIAVALKNQTNHNELDVVTFLSTEHVSCQCSCE